MSLDWNQQGKRIARRARDAAAASQASRLVTALLLAMVLTTPARPARENMDDTDKKSPILFSPASGVYAANVSLQLSARASSPVIRYTLDGSEPDESAPAYGTPLPITNSILVRAKTFSKEGPSTVIAAEVYTILDDKLANFDSNLPLVVVNSFGTNLTHEHKIEGAVQCVDGGTNRTQLTGPLDFSGRALINIRGRASLRYPKTSFSLKTLNGEGDASSASILKFPAGSDWVLYAPYADKALLRDVLAYELHAQMGHWAPRAKFVEVFVSQGGAKLSPRDYVGVYVFEERIKRDAERVSITKLKPDDDTEPRITGGYIFKKDHVDQGGGPVGGEGYGAGPVQQNTRLGFPTGPGGFPANPKGFPPPATATRTYSSSSSSSSRAARVITNHLGFASTRLVPEGNRDSAFRDEYNSLKDEESFRTTRTNEFYFVEPDQDELTSVQKSWLKRHLNQAEAALHGPDFRDPAKGYRAYLDIDSFIDYHLITEMTKNVDGYRFSVFYHKDRGGKIKADPVWDWNLSFGNANGKQGWMPEHWLWPQLDDRECTWYRRLFDDPDFGQRYVDRWSQFRTNIFATKKILRRIDEMAALLQEAQKRNYERWPMLNHPINPNYYVNSTYKQEVDWVKNFAAARLKWMEMQFPPVPAISITADARGRSATLSVTGSEIYFTLDGTDPRAGGGEISKAAQTYQAPLVLNSGAKIFARVLQEGRWSGPAVWGE